VLTALLYRKMILCKNQLKKTIADASAKKQIEEDSFKNQKFETIGVLASGVAHEFNNINAIIKGSIELIFMNEHKEEIPKSIRHQLITVKKMIERSSVLTRDLLIFSDDSNNGYEIFRLIDVVEDVLHDLSDMQEIELIIDIPNDSCVYANAIKIKSVIYNLITNAWHSMAESEKKKLTLTCSEVCDFISFVVKDTGCGIPEKDISKVSDPFFSNKGIYAEAGTIQSNFEAKGLGLSICQTIIEKHHNGKIDIKSEVGVGTEVTILIPKANSTNCDSLPLNEHFKIAVLDSYLNIGSVCKKMLDLCNYQVKEASSVRGLITELIEKNVDLVLIDEVSLENQNLQNFLKENSQKIPVIVLSDKKDAQTSNEKDLGIKNIFSKPYFFKTLAWQIWDELN